VWWQVAPCPDGREKCVQDDPAAQGGGNQKRGDATYQSSTGHRFMVYLHMETVPSATA